MADEKAEPKVNIKKLHEKIEVLENEKRVFLALKEAEISPSPIKPRTRKTHEGVSVGLLSDIHYEEEVAPERVAGLNEYNPDIAADSIRRYFQNTLSLVRKERAAAPILQHVQWFGGDMITNTLHAELAETNTLGTVSALLAVKSALVSGIEFLLEHGDFEKLHFVCSPGNHGRMSKEWRTKNKLETSLETFLYHTIKDWFKDEPGVTFHIADGELTYEQILDSTIRFAHGDSKGIKYQGGIGGITIPLNRIISSGWDRERPADYTCIGHFHQLVFAPRFCVNGSVIGYSEYARSCGFPPEIPQQAMFVVVKGQRQPCCFNRVFVRDF